MMDPALEVFAASELPGQIALPSPSLRVGVSKVVADAEQLDQRCRQRYAEVGSAIKRHPNRRLIEEQKAHTQFSSLIDAGEAGIGLLLCLRENTAGIDTLVLTDVLHAIDANTNTVRLLSKAGLITLDGNLLVLSEEGTQIASRIVELAE